MNKEEEIEHDNTDNIVCPYCGYENTDSWEYSEDNEIDCDECKKRFVLSVNHSVDYTTSKILCKEGEHKYIFEKAFLTYSKMTWLGTKYAEHITILPEEEWRFIEIMKCSNCDNEVFDKVIPREEWIEKYPEGWEQYQDWIARDKAKEIVK